MPSQPRQFDAGILRLARVGNQFEVRSKLSNDPLHRQKLALNAAHTLDAALVLWHFNFHHNT